MVHEYTVRAVGARKQFVTSINNKAFKLMLGRILPDTQSIIAIVSHGIYSHLSANCLIGDACDENRIKTVTQSNIIARK